MVNSSPRGPWPRLGVDVLRIDELRNVLGRARLLAYLYAPEELHYAQDLSADRRHEFLTGRFGAKEAIAKVLGIGIIGYAPPRDIAVIRGERGAPQVVLRGRQAARADELGITTVSVSIAHKGSLVIAAAIGWPPADCGGRGHTADIASALLSGAARMTSGR